MKMRRILSAALIALLIVSVFPVPAGVESVFTTIDDAIVFCREQAVGRNPEFGFTLTVPLDVADAAGGISEYYSTVRAKIRSGILDHTGVGNEGDYLRWSQEQMTFETVISASGSQAVYNVTVKTIFYSSAEQEAELTSELDRIYTSLDLKTKSEYEKVIAITDWICDNVTYDHENLNNEEYGLKYTAYAAAVNGTSVCQGYASLFYRMALDNGLDARGVSGIANGGAHSWNIVRIDGIYYLIDTTWAAINVNNKEKYILRGTNDFGVDTASHKADWPDGFLDRYTISASAYTVPGTGCEAHTWDDGVITDPATCSAEGVMTYTCAVCDEKRTETIEKDANNHVGGTELRNVSSMTCGADGYTGDTYCKSCGELLLRGQKITASGEHVWDNGVVKTEPTYDTTGIKTFTCTVCGMTRDETIEKLKPQVMPGDVNGDGDILANDARLALRASAKLEPLDETQFLAADVDGDGKILAGDARQILRYSAKLQQTFEKAAV